MCHEQTANPRCPSSPGADSGRRVAADSGATCGRSAGVDAINAGAERRKPRRARYGSCSRVERQYASSAQYRHVQWRPAVTPGGHRRNGCLRCRGLLQRGRRATCGHPHFAASGCID